MAKIGRNDPCPCGSGKKYKKCCIKKNLDFLTLDSEEISPEMIEHSHEADIEKETVKEEEYEDIDAEKEDSEKDNEEEFKKAYDEENDEEIIADKIIDELHYNDDYYKLSEDEIDIDHDYYYDIDEYNAIYDELSKMPTDEILNLAREFSVDIDKEKFVDDLKRLQSIIYLYEEWVRKYEKNPLDSDNDLYIAVVTILKRRLADDILTIEEIDHKLDSAFDMIEDNYKPEIAKSIELWHELKEFVTPDIRDITELEHKIHRPGDLILWIMEFLSFMGEIGMQDERIKVAEDIIETFPHAGDFFILDVHAQIADSFIKMGKKEEGEAVIREVIEKNPKSAYGYILLADIYSEEPYGSLEDLEKAEKFLKNAPNEDSKYIDGVLLMQDYIHKKKMELERQIHNQEVLK